MLYDKTLVDQHLQQWEQYLGQCALPTWDELPTIDLYMEQVVALLTQYLNFLPNEDKKYTVVTVSAINNYVRMKIMPAPNKKKYSRKHIAYLIMICTLKQSLNISYIQKIIPTGLSENEVRTIYNNYVQQHRAASLFFVEQMKIALDVHRDAEPDNNKAIENLVITSAIVSGYTKFMAEQIIGWPPESKTEE
jgi:hypothetical protein